MEEDYFCLASYLEECSCVFVYMRTIQGQYKRGLAITSNEHPTLVKYIQFKSPDEAGDDSYEFVYLKKETTIASVIRYKDHPFERLRQLHEVTGFFYGKAVDDAVKIAHVYKGLIVPMIVFRHSMIMIQLGLAKNTGDWKRDYCRMKFIDNPPHL